MKNVSVNKRYVVIRLTHKELRELRNAINNNDGDGDWVDFLTKGGGEKDSVKNYYSVVDKLDEAAEAAEELNNMTKH